MAAGPAPHLRRAETRDGQRRLRARDSRLPAKAAADRSPIPTARTGRGLVLCALALACSWTVRADARGGTGPLMAQRGASAAATKAQCLEAYSDAQRLRKDGLLVAARAKLILCAQDGCPRVTKTDCVPWLDEVERSTPTLVVVAKDRAGRDVTDVRVTIDDEVVVEQLDGRAIPVDPGTRELRFEYADAPDIEKQLVFHESVKDRRVEVTFEIGEATGPSTDDPSPDGTTQDADAAESTSSTAIAGWVLTGLGVAGMGMFAAFAVVGRGEVDEYQDTCAPTKTCDEDDVSATRTKLVVADVSLGVGLAALTTGLILIIYDAVSDDEPSSTEAVELSVGPMPGGAAAGAMWRF